MGTKNNELVVMFVQKEGDKVVNTAMVQYPEGDLNTINIMQLDLMESMVKVARGWAATRAAAGAPK